MSAHHQCVGFAVGGQCSSVPYPRFFWGPLPGLRSRLPPLHRQLTEPPVRLRVILYRDCDVCPQMAVIPAGRFKMGSDEGHAEERPSHAVVIARPFATGIHEITVDEWDACLREGGCRQSPEQGLQGKTPMTNVSWDDAQGI